MSEDFRPTDFQIGFPVYTADGHVMLNETREPNPIVEDTFNNVRKRFTKYPLYDLQRSEGFLYTFTQDEIDKAEDFSEALKARRARIANCAKNLGIRVSTRKGTARDGETVLVVQRTE